ncbi:MAG: hypothetical protein Q9227_003295 [Pyrenula ochraceoflavens]
MASNLGSLTEELVALIFSFVIDSSPNTVPALGLVNRYFYNVLQPLTHSRKTIEMFHEEHSSDLLRKWLENAHVLRGLRYLTIRNLIWWKWTSERPCHKPYSASGEGCVSEEDLAEHALLLLEVITKAARLITIDVNVSPTTISTKADDTRPLQLPALFFQTLRNAHPTARLYVHDWERLNPHELTIDAAERCLAESPNLVAISMENKDCLVKALVFEEIIKSAPNLEAVQVRVGNPAPHLTSHELSHSNDRNLVAALKRSSRRASLKTMTIVLAPTLDKSWIEYGSGITDLTKLESLNLPFMGDVRDDFIKDFAHSFPALRRFTAGTDYQDDIVNLHPNLFTTLPLESLTLPLVNLDYLPTLLDSYAAANTLTSLDLRGRSYSSDDLDSFTPSQITAIGHSFPHLRRLCGIRLDAYPPDPDPTTTTTSSLDVGPLYTNLSLQALATFSHRLDHLHLTIPSAPWDQQSQHPFLHSYAIHHTLFPPNPQLPSPTADHMLHLEHRFSRAKTSSSFTRLWWIRPAERDDLRARGVLEICECWGGEDDTLFDWDLLEEGVGRREGVGGAKSYGEVFRGWGVWER